MLKEKLENAKPTEWVREGLSDDEVKEIIQNAKLNTDLDEN